MIGLVLFHVERGRLERIDALWTGEIGFLRTIQICRSALRKGTFTLLMAIDARNRAATWIASGDGTAARPSYNSSIPPGLTIGNPSPRDSAGGATARISTVPTPPLGSLPAVVALDFTTSTLSSASSETANSRNSARLRLGSNKKK